MHDDRAMIRGRNARKRALHRSGVSISLSRLSDRTITSHDLILISTFSNICTRYQRNLTIFVLIL